MNWMMNSSTSITNSPQIKPANTAPSQKSRLWLGLAVLFFITFLIRIYHLDAVDLRGDEGYSVVHWTATPFSDAWMKLAKEEPHPMGAYTMYWAWNGLVGKSVFATRLLSVFGNLIGAAVVIAIARRLFTHWWIICAVGILWMLNPFLIWHAQDARTYGVLSALTPLTFYWLLRTIDHPDSSQRLRVWLPYILLQTAAIYIYYFEAFWLMAQGLYVLSLRRVDVLKQAFKAWLVAGILSIPVGLQLYWLLFVSDYQGTASDASVSMLFEWFVPTLLFGQNTISIFLGISFVLIFIGGLYLVQRRYQSARLFLLWYLIPPFLLLIASNFSSFFRPRYVTTVIPALIVGMVIIAFYGIESLSKNKRNGVYAVGLLVLIVGGVSIVEIYDYYQTDTPKAPDWQGLTDYLEARTTDNDIVIFGQPDPAIEYYYQGNLNFIPLETYDVEVVFSDILATYDGIFLLSGERTAEVGQYLQANAQHIEGDTYQGVNQFRSWEVNPREIQYPLDIQFGDVVVLQGYTLLEGDTGGKILFLYWNPLKTTETDHSILVHLVTGEQNDDPVVGVHDHGVAYGIISTRLWQTGDLIRDPVALPEGQYWIRVGMYRTGNIENQIPLADLDLQQHYQGRYLIGRTN